MGFEWGSINAWEVRLLSCQYRKIHGAVPQHYNENHLGKWVANKGSMQVARTGKTSPMIT
jgi:hypothetical protein